MSGEIMESCKLLPFTLGAQHLLIEAQLVMEVGGAMRTIDIPGADNRVSRAFLWKKQAIPLISLQHCLSLDDMGEGTQRTLILGPSEGTVAIGADQVGAVLSADHDAFVETDLSPGSYLSARLEHDGITAHRLDLPALLKALMKDPTASHASE